MERDRSPEQKEKRGDYLRAKIAKAEDELKSMGCSPERPMSEWNVLVAVPCHTGQIGFATVISLINLLQTFQAARVRYEVQCFANSSLITIVRNRAANRIAFETDNTGHPFTHLFFVDSDCSGFEDHVLAMLKADKPIIGLPYAFKTPNWMSVARAARNGVPPEALSEFLGEPVIQADGPFETDKPAKVRSVGTGMMLIKREVFQGLADAHPEWKFKADAIYSFGKVGPTIEFYFDFFQMGIDPKTQQYRPEDFFLSAKARELGFETWILPNARTVHTGNFDFVLNLPARASFGSTSR
jgi:hypothetical protein